MKVVVHVFEGMSMFHLAVPSLVFGELGRVGQDPAWEIRTWSESGADVHTGEGARLTPQVAPPAVVDADLLVFPSWYDDLRTASDDLVDHIRTVHARGTQVAGLCLGAFPLVDSGLLDGRTAVTHWAAARHLASRRSGMTVLPDALYVDHGDVITSAGTASAIDACLHIVRTSLGSEVAAQVARRLVVAPHRDGGQAQFVERPIPEHGGVGAVGATVDWALAHLDEPLSVEALSAHAGMSRRNFTRRFTEAMGTTPAHWILGRRLDEVRRLLEETDLTVERVAAACGFGSAVTLRQQFVRTYGTTPTSYRQRFTERPAGLPLIEQARSPDAGSPQPRVSARSGSSSG